MKIKASKAIKDLKGEDILNNTTQDPFTVGTALANILIDAPEGGKAKMYVLAMKFAESKDVEVDEADLSLIKKTVESDKKYGNLVCGQLILMLEGLKEEKK